MMQSSKQLQIPLAKPQREIIFPTAGLFGSGSGAIFRRGRSLEADQGADHPNIHTLTLFCDSDKKKKHPILQVRDILPISIISL
jgi:hypothetical protein